jgi:predicted nucleic acid-binding protein
VSGFLIDTNAISELRKPRPDDGLVTWITSSKESAFYLSVITLGELRTGIDLVEDKKKRNDLERWLISDVTARFKGRILPFDAEIADRWGRIEASARRKGGKLAVVDAMLAATAAHFNLTIVTRNERDFSRTEIPTINPWSA